MPVVGHADKVFPSFVALLGADRVGNVVPVGSMQSAGGNVSYGSDWDNVPELYPWLALQTLITRVIVNYKVSGER